MDKPALRKEYVARRKAMTMADSRDKSARIAVRTQGLINWPAVRRIHVYRSDERRREVDTTWVEAFVYAMWPKVSVMIGDPAKSALIPDDRFDIIIVPLIVFDDRLNRIGFGGGWYDRFIASQPDAITIGLAYESQRVSQVTAEPHDEKLHYVVTESKVYESI